MNTGVQPVELSQSELARRRLIAVRGEPLFLADWCNALMIHYEVDPVALRPLVPFQLDLHDDRAFVTLVAFTLRNLRPRFGGRLTQWMLFPIATHPFLNVRTYVCQAGERGIYFLAEWLTNWLSVALGPRIFGLPYRLGRLNYRHQWQEGVISGSVTDPSGQRGFRYKAVCPGPCEFIYAPRGSREEWLMERYAAFTKIGKRARFFRVFHQPWRQTPVKVKVTDKKLVDDNWELFRDAMLVGANFSPGLSDVWMGRPQHVTGQPGIIS